MGRFKRFPLKSMWNVYLREEVRLVTDREGRRGNKISTYVIRGFVRSHRLTQQRASLETESSSNCTENEETRFISRSHNVTVRCKKKKKKDKFAP